MAFWRGPSAPPTLQTSWGARAAPSGNTRDGNGPFNTSQRAGCSPSPSCQADSSYLSRALTQSPLLSSSPTPPLPVIVDGPSAPKAYGQQSERSVGKGLVRLTSSTATPDHIHRHPRCKQPLSALMQNATSTDRPTRSPLVPLHSRAASATSVAVLFEVAAAACRDATRSIIAACEERQRRFLDKSWALTDRANLYPPGAPEDCTVAEPSVLARLSDLFPGRSLFGGDRFSTRVAQGRVGDCFLLGAMLALHMAVGQPRSPLERLFVEHSTKWGVYGVMFYKDGSWEWVIVDDFVPVEGNSPLFCSCSSNELWPMVLEKAYAKMHRCWDTIDGGWEREALVDLSGGTAQILDLNASPRSTGFEELVQTAENGRSVVVCAVGNQAPDSNVGRRAVPGTQGLRHGHAYQIAGGRRTADGTAFLLLRNHWGADAVWRGAYGVGAQEWKQNRGHAVELGVNPLAPAQDPATFWIPWTEANRILTAVTTLEFVDSRSSSLTLYNLGKRNPACPDQTYIVSVLGSVRLSLVLVLGQEDPKMFEDHAAAKGTPYAMMRLSCFRLKRVPERYADLQSCLDVRVPTPRDYAREVSCAVSLEAGYYSLIAQLSDCRDGIPFYIRLVLPPDDHSTILQVHRLDNPLDTSVSTALPTGWGQVERKRSISLQRSSSTSLQAGRLAKSPSLLIPNAENRRTD